MILLIQDILIPYVYQIQSEINDDNHPAILILDNLHQHLTSDVKNELEKIKPYFLIPFLVHS